MNELISLFVMLFVLWVAWKVLKRAARNLRKNRKPPKKRPYNPNDWDMDDVYRVKTTEDAAKRARGEDE